MMTDDRPRLRPSRRSLVRSTVWSVPVVAVAAAAPAYALSPCPTTYTINWNTFTTGATVTSATAGGVTMTVVTSGANTAANNSKIYDTTASSKELRFYDVDNTTNTSQTITFNFSAQVKNLTFTVIDIDQRTTPANSQFNDQVVVNTVGYTGTFASPTALQGNGTALSPYRSSTGNVVADGSSLATVTLSWSASLNSVSFSYNQGGQADNGTLPHIGIGNVSYNPVLC